VSLSGALPALVAIAMGLLWLIERARANRAEERLCHALEQLERDARERRQAGGEELPAPGIGALVPLTLGQLEDLLEALEDHRDHTGAAPQRTERLLEKVARDLRALEAREQ